MCIAVPGRVASIGAPTGASIPATVAFPDRELAVNLVMVPDARVGDYVIVHSGYAIRIVSPGTAAEATALLCPNVADSAAQPIVE